MPARIDLTGKRFGRLIAVEFCERPNRSGASRYAWKCVCDCGREHVVSGGALREGRTRSCGCLDAETRAQRNHNLSKTSTYKIWEAMISRCEYEGNIGYAHYGGRGIRVCARWRQSFRAFLDDMGWRPDGKSIDRIDSNGNYEPGNCRWATRQEQNQNQRHRPLTAEMVATIKAKLLNGGGNIDLAKEYGVRPATICRIRNGRSWSNIQPAAAEHVNA